MYAGTTGDTYALKFGYSLSDINIVTDTITCAITNIPDCVGVGCTTPNRVCHAQVYSKLNWIIVKAVTSTWAQADTTPEAKTMVTLSGLRTRSSTTPTANEATENVIIGYGNY